MKNAGCYSQNLHLKNIKSSEYLHPKVTGREISLKCKGLPLAAKTHLGVCCDLNKTQESGIRFWRVIYGIYQKMKVISF